MNYAGDDYVNDYLAETIAIAEGIDREALAGLVDLLADTRDHGGTVYVLGLGGSLANATHLAADLRMWTDLPAAAPDSLPELTAYANDNGWPLMLMSWLMARRLASRDLVLVLSVGGGGVPDAETSRPLVAAMQYAITCQSHRAAIVGEPGGLVSAQAQMVVKIPTVHPARKTEHVEGWQGVLSHMLVSHPKLRRP